MNFVIRETEDQVFIYIYYKRLHVSNPYVFILVTKIRQPPPLPKKIKLWSKFVV